MAKFVPLQQSNGVTVYVNADHVVTASGSETSVTTLKLTDSQTLYVQKNVAEVAGSLSS
jgi:hypothetical protein